MHDTPTPSTRPDTHRPRLGTLFSYDWDADGFAKHEQRYVFDHAGFDLFSFPSNARLIGLELERLADRLARTARQRAWVGVCSHHEQFGALTAALVAERVGLPGTPVHAVLACQHKLHARQVLHTVAPEANVAFSALDAAYGGSIPEGVHYPCYVKPIKAAFSVLAREVHNRAELHAHTRFGWRELWVIRRLVEPFERVVRQRLPQAGSAHRLLMEQPVHAPQFCLDGWVHDGQCHALGVVDAICYPGTQAFMRWDHPSRLDASVQARALDVARRFLAAVGFSHGLFNMEFFYDAASGKLSVIEFNPRLASQFSDLYQRVHGIDPHAMTLALAQGDDPLHPRDASLAPLPHSATAGAAASLVYRAFAADQVPAMPSASQQRALQQAFPDAMLMCMPKSGHGLDRDFKWLGSHRYGVLHLGGRDAANLRQRAEAASALLGWPAPYAEAWRPATAAQVLQPLSHPLRSSVLAPIAGGAVVAD